MKLLHPKKAAALSLAAVLFLTSCSAPPPEENETAAEDPHLETIAALEAEIQKMREEQFIKEAAYTAEIRALQSKLDALAGTSPDDAVEDELIIHYRLEGNNAVITGYSGKSTLLTLPATLDGHPVIAIGERAFENSSIAAIVLPEGLETVGWFAFYGCASLLNVTIPASVTSIGYAVFDGCKHVKIVGTSGSYAEKYAKSYGISFLNI